MRYDNYDRSYGQHHIHRHRDVTINNFHGSERSALPEPRKSVTINNYYDGKPSGGNDRLGDDDCSKCQSGDRYGDDNIDSLVAQFKKNVGTSKLGSMEEDNFATKLDELAAMDGVTGNITTDDVKDYFKKNGGKEVTQAQASAMADYFSSYNLTGNSGKRELLADLNDYEPDPSNSIPYTPSTKA